MNLYKDSKDKDFLFEDDKNDQVILLKIKDESNNFDQISAFPNLEKVKEVDIAHDNPLLLRTINSFQCHLLNNVFNLIINV
jgi:hypothetical protein